jgi:signal transduction histidine kinase
MAQGRASRAPRGTIRGAMPGRSFRAHALYAAAALASFLIAGVLSFSAPATLFDNAVYDLLHRLAPAPAPEAASAAVVLAIDDQTLKDNGGPRNLRPILTRALNLLAAAPPAVTAVDLTLTDATVPAEDEALAEALARLPNVVLACEMLPDSSAWQDPAPVLRSQSVTLGHDHTLPGPIDDINRAITLERVAGRTRRWALSLEAYRLYRKLPEVVSSPTDLALGSVIIPSRWDEGRPLRVHYRAPGSIETVPVRDLFAHPALAKRLAGRPVFVGVTALSAARDRLFTPLSALNGNRYSPGVEIHAQAFETLGSRHYLTETGLSTPLLLALAAALLTAAAFAFAPATFAYAAGIVVLGATAAAPWFYFTRDAILPPFAPLAAATLTLLASASLRFFSTRRALVRAESDRARYQQAFHFVAHELRTPLTAIQGSSELISRYNLPEAKRKELSQMINVESKRLARMITTFLDVERLSAGQMELKAEDVSAADIAEVCVSRARPLAERKQIRLICGEIPPLMLHGDRELIEYALYNIITNAIKYSPESTEVRITAAPFQEKGHSFVRISVADQGMGMSRDEVKRLFTRFYRTERAQRAGITGTGIGLSIVREIVAHHHGHVEVESAPNRGATFSLFLPAAAPLPASAQDRLEEA